MRTYQIKSLVYLVLFATTSLVYQAMVPNSEHNRESQTVYVKIESTQVKLLDNTLKAYP